MVSCVLLRFLGMLPAEMRNTSLITRTWVCRWSSQPIIFGNIELAVCKCRADDDFWWNVSHSGDRCSHDVLYLRCASSTMLASWPWSSMVRMRFLARSELSSSTHISSGPVSLSANISFYFRQLRIIQKWICENTLCQCTLSWRFACHRYNCGMETAATTTYSHKLSPIYLKTVSLIGVCFLIFNVLRVIQLVVLFCFLIMCLLYLSCICIYLSTYCCNVCV